MENAEANDQADIFNVMKNRDSVLVWTTLEHRHIRKHIELSENLCTYCAYPEKSGQVAVQFPINVIRINERRIIPKWKRL